MHAGLYDGAGERPRLRTIPAGDLAALEREVRAAKVRFGLPGDTPVRSCYEAGRDGFWLHRWLGPQGIDNVVVDSSSIDVNRKWRRAKTDRLDACKLLQLLMRWAGGERKVWSVVHVPSAAAEDDRQLPRELDTVRADRTRLRNRIQALLATQGVRLVLDATFACRLGAVGTGDGRPFPAALRARILREWAALATVEARAAVLSDARTALMTSGPDAGGAGGAAVDDAARRRGHQWRAVQCGVVRHAHVRQWAAARGLDGAGAGALSERPTRAGSGDQ